MHTGNSGCDHRETGYAPKPWALLFPGMCDAFNPIHPNMLRLWHVEVRKAAVQPDLRFHDLRHMVLTLLS